MPTHCGSFLIAALGAMADASPPPAAVPVPEVTIQAKRDAIEQRVREYVRDSLYLENDEGAPTWSSPVCPAIAGVSHAEAEFMLTRLSATARAAGVPLGAARCTPANLYVLVTAKPEKVLQWTKAHWHLFQGTPVSIVNDFIATFRPVRAWYTSQQVGADGASAGVGLPGGASLSSQPGAPTFAGHEPSRLVRNVEWNLTAVVVVVDKTQLHGIRIGQLTDYISMHAFSHLKPRADFGDVPTILRLFENPAQAPEALTSWDEAFLKSLYHTDPKLIYQRESVITRMIKDIVPEVPPGASINP